MARTGYMIYVYEDINPSSSSFGTTKEEKQLDSVNCNVNATPEWVEDTVYCEMNENGSYTGYQITVERDVSEDSPTYNETRETRVWKGGEDEECEADSTTPEWVNIGDPYCRQIPYLPSGELGNDGFWVQQQQDMNEYSPTGDQIRDVETYDLTHCPLPDTTPNEVIIGQYCETTGTSFGIGGKRKTGIQITTYMDTNKYSPTYTFGQPMERRELNFEDCPPFGADYVLEANPMVYNDDGQGGFGIITVSKSYVRLTGGEQYGLTWTPEVVIGSSWLHMGVVEESKFEFGVDYNDSGERRTGSIVITQQKPSEKSLTIEIVQEKPTEESGGDGGDENTPEYIETHGEKISYGFDGVYEGAMVNFSPMIYSLEDGFWNGGQETQNSGDLYILEKFVDKHETINFTLSTKDRGSNLITFFVGSYRFSYTSDTDTTNKEGVAGYVNGKPIKVKINRLLYAGL